MRHYHIEKPFLCVKSTMMGWAVSPVCAPEIVEMCSEMMVGDVSFLSDLGSMVDELRRRGAGETAIQGLRLQMQPA